MSLAYILDGGMNDEPGTGAEMCARYLAAQKIYDDIRGWTGLTPEQVIHEKRPDGQSYRQGIGTIRRRRVSRSCSSRPKTIPRTTCARSAPTSTWGRTAV
jgi:hypothetical protein